MARQTAADHVFDNVVSDILAGALRPRDQISERDLVTRFGVSRTPVREAIKRLFARGFVESGPKGVAVVMDLAGDDVRKLYELRLQLEGNAAPLTCANVTPAELEELRRINRQFANALGKRDLVRMLEVRSLFHARLAAATRNRWLADILVMLRDRAYVVRHLHWQDAERAAQTLQIHDQMIDALARRDARRYRELVAQQIRAGLDCYENQLRAPPAKRRVAASGEVRRARSAAK
ncbi:MAG TPA: GntR family transcriptional regulator [Casimicrobiaceae bacterium]|nr:GntR family transcriptional regulator [Casimicrobiaceae bacterium]